MTKWEWRHIWRKVVAIAFQWLIAMVFIFLFSFVTLLLGFSLDNKWVFVSLWVLGGALGFTAGDGIIQLWGRKRMTRRK